MGRGTGGQLPGGKMEQHRSLETHHRRATKQTDGVKVGQGTVQTKKSKDEAGGKDIRVNLHKKLVFRFFKSFFIVILLQLSQFLPFFPPLCMPALTPTVHPHTVVHVCGSFIHVL